MELAKVFSFEQWTDVKESAYVLPISGNSNIKWSAEVSKKVQKRLENRFAEYWAAGSLRRIVTHNRWGDYGHRDHVELRICVQRAFDRVFSCGADAADARRRRSNTGDGNGDSSEFPADNGSPLLLGPLTDVIGDSSTSVSVVPERSAEKDKAVSAYTKSLHQGGTDHTFSPNVIFAPSSRIFSCVPRQYL